MFRELDLHDRIPIAPEALLRRHKVQEPHDTRFRSAARLSQALWREELGYAAGTFETESGERRRIGSLLGEAAAEAGKNFVSPDVHRLVLRELAYREAGAMIDEHRLTRNLLSSMPLSFNLFGPLALDLDRASDFGRFLWPWLFHHVDAVVFEHSPGRGDDRFTGDYSAFDVLLRGRSEDGRRVFAAIEVKFVESMWEPTREPSARCQELSMSCDLFRDGSDPDLRQRPLQQLWREHLLAQGMVGADLYDQGAFILIAPRLNRAVQNAGATYQAHVRPINDVSFHRIDLETVVESLDEIGAAAEARYLTERYLDLGRVERAIEQHIVEATSPKPEKPTRKRKAKIPSAAKPKVAEPAVPF